MTCKPTIEVEEFLYDYGYSRDVKYYVVRYKPWLFGLMKKERTLVATMPRHYHDVKSLMDYLRKTFIEDYKYDENGDLDWS